ncbi:MAG: tetratricopeptide repeat protein [Candidatus Omnitrophica bacterium]|nr:tetratricopeptide repeat protein [Candidatus Omnitrophota bacterium]
MNNRFSFALIGAIVAVSLVTGGCNKDDDYTAEKLFWKANKRLTELKGGDPKKKLTREESLELIPEYAQVVERCPSTQLAARAQFIVADLYVTGGQVDRAREELMKVINNFPKMGNLRAEAQFYRGYLYETQEKDWGKAREEYERVLSNHEGTMKSLEVPIYIAQHYEREGDVFTAREEYDKAIRYYEDALSKGLSKVYVANCMEVLSTCYIKKRRWDDALSLLKDMAIEHPDTPHAASAMLKISNICQTLKEPEREISLYKEILGEIRGKNPPLETRATLRLAHVYMVSGEGEEARAILRNLQGRNEERKEFCSKMELMIARSYELEDNWEKAEETYNAIEKEYPLSSASFQAPMMIAQHYLRSGETDRAGEIFATAIDRYNTIIEQNPDSELAAAAQDYISMSYLFQNKWEESIANLEELIANFPNSSRAATSLFAIASIYQNFLKKPDEALKAYESFITQYPDHEWNRLARQQIEVITRQQDAGVIK